ncbi:hypothetical protein OMR58_24990 [Erwinia sp. INIA-01]|uniref:hypothetical protein n=1 Tax=Erwinia sp. INIA01 TaxID=2991500 RepID=UPI00222452ED|nr:hypothetical protein [Erwinia sp. INIA01]MCW1877700.1 hypothetical protein [Erwinia sp. INIA01]
MLSAFNIFGVTHGGDVKIGDGVSITLIPHTSYLKNTPDYNYDTQQLSLIDSRTLVGRFETTTDAQGKFEF